MPELPPDNEGNPACEQLGWTRFTHDIEIKGDVRHKGPEPKGERKKRFIPRCAERERPKGSGSGNGSGSGPQPPGPALRCSPALPPPPLPPPLGLRWDPPEQKRDSPTARASPGTKASATASASVAPAEEKGRRTLNERRRGEPSPAAPRSSAPHRCAATNNDRRSDTAGLRSCTPQQAARPLAAGPREDGQW